MRHTGNARNHMSVLMFTLYAQSPNLSVTPERKRPKQRHHTRSCAFCARQHCRRVHAFVRGMHIVVAPFGKSAPFGGSRSGRRPAAVQAHQVAVTVQKSAFAVQRTAVRCLSAKGAFAVSTEQLTVTVHMACVLWKHSSTSTTVPL